MGEVTRAELIVEWAWVHNNPKLFTDSLGRFIANHEIEYNIRIENEGCRCIFIAELK